LNASLLWPDMVLTGKSEQIVCMPNWRKPYRQPEGRIRTVVDDVGGRRRLARLLGRKALVERRRKDVALKKRDLLDYVLCA
jgi:hypothetical protein